MEGLTKIDGKMGQELVAVTPATPVGGGISGPVSAPPTTSLAPGFRFHPTDEELVRYYLRRKACGKPFRFQAVSEIDVYKSEPWELACNFLLFFFFFFFSG